MGLLPWSFGFLLIISILSWSAVGRMSEETLVTRSIIATVTEQADESAEAISKKSTAAYNLYCEKKGKKPIEDENEDEEEEEERQRRPVRRSRNQKHRRRLTSKLHIPALFGNEDTAQKNTQEKIFRNLIKTLYAEQPLFTPQGSNDAHLQQLFEEVRLKALEWGPKLPMSKAAYLANIELSGYKKEEKQFILFLILKGGEGEFFEGARCHVRPLLPYISMAKKDCCISVYLASVPLLMAIFENSDVVEKIVDYRKTIGKKIRDEQERAGSLVGSKEQRDILDILSDDFKNQFEACLPQGIEAQYIDFRVSGTTPKDFVERRRKQPAAGRGYTTG